MNAFPRLSVVMPRRTWAVLVLLATASAAAPAAAATWTAATRDQLYCLSLATPAERASLSTTLPGDTADDGLSYWRNDAPTPGDRIQRYLMLLASIGYLADRSNDEALRSQLLRIIAADARRFLDSAPTPLRQIRRCAHAALLDSALEQEDVRSIEGIVKSLILEYYDRPIGTSVEDLPLVHALRALSLSSTSGEWLRLLVGYTYRRAETLRDTDPRRARRLFAAAAEGLVVLGETPRAWGLASLANEIVQREAVTIEERWATFPALYDSNRAEHGVASAAVLGRAMQQAFPLPPHTELIDNELEYKICARLFEAATEDVQRRLSDDLREHHNANAWELRAHEALLDEHDHAPVPIALLRAAFSSFGDKTALKFVWTRNKATALRDYETAYAPLLRKLEQNNWRVPVSDARGRFHFQTRVGNWLDTLALLGEVLPEKRAEIAAMAFSGMQLPSSGQLTAGFIAPLLEKIGDDGVRKNLDRVIGLQINWTWWLRRQLSEAYLPDPTGADARKLNQQYRVLSIQENEQKVLLPVVIRDALTAAPDVATLLSPAPLRLKKIQSLLHADEALVSVLTAGEGVFVVAASSNAVSFRVAPIKATQLNGLVHRVRASLMPSTNEGKLSIAPFDAGAAFEIHAATLGLVQDVTRGKAHIFWHSSGALAAVPPGILIGQQPRAQLVSGAADLRSLAWIIDKHAISVVPDIKMFAMYRTVIMPEAARYGFIGIGAPGLSPEELQGARAARSGALAGAVDTTSLAELPKLPETADELRRLAAAMGTDRSILLLGRDANRSRIRETLNSGRAEIVAFATHGFVAGEFADMPEPSLLLDVREGSNGQEALLPSSEIGRLALTTQLVIVTACNTATSDGRPRGESFTGLARSFTEAGAKALLVSHWPVASGAAAELSVRTIELARKDHVPLASALARAMRELRNAADAGDVATAHPFFWAPFVFVGDGARTLP